MVEKFLTEKQLGDVFSISRSTLNKLRSQDLPYHMIGNSVRYRQTDIEEWLESRHHLIDNNNEED